MPHSGLLSLLAESPSLKQLLAAVSARKTPALFLGAGKYARTASVAALCQRLNRPAFLVLPTPEEAVTARRELADLLGSDRVMLFPAREVMPFESRGNEESLWMRIKCLAELGSYKDPPAGPSAGSPPLLVMPVTALARRLASPATFRAGCMAFRAGDQALPEEILRRLVDLGYERAYTVEGVGQVALRGGIMDVFPPHAESPFRVEFAFDEVDSIRTFDPQTQTSVSLVEEVFLTPASDWLEGDPFTIFDYAPQDRFIVVEGLERCIDVVQEFERTGHEVASARLVAGTMRAGEEAVYIPSWHTADSLNHADAVFELVLRSHEGVKFQEVIESDTSVQVGFAGRLAGLVDELQDMVARARRVVILTGNKDRLTTLYRELDRHDIPLVTCDSVDEVPVPGAVTLSVGIGESGFNADAVQLSLFTEAEIFGRPLVRRRPRKKSGVPLDWRDLTTGDYVVHANHGIGKFMGLKTMTVNGATRDYLHIKYAGSDALYVPTDQVDLVEKYVGPEGHVPQLQRLGSGDWQRTKSRVKKSVEDMARKLLMLEASRKARKGHAFCRDSAWQRQFEEAFEYEDTEDQARATEEIKSDMEESVPMDRLLCGDVGYGKTEVAMRCAFKAVMDSKQVCILVPTTILAEQHYTTFTRRFTDYPVSVEVLSRFRTRAEQKRILKDLELGAVDIVIGTHRLLSKDVKIKDLGLLIIDEEHRFGVAQKERLKELSQTCDVLTLTATPIPRTLNMALSGIRDISVIETPPEGRFPVETYVVPENPGLIAQAIRREIRRGGQVFYVYNRVRTMARVCQKVQSLVPEARIAVGHGKMSEQELSRTMQDFLQGGYDVLISTTIIESGLDLPNVNTLIVEDADKLGLAQLYQLRGRVGRSSRIAYAYFTYRHTRSLSVAAEERLDALRDFSDMGSGFKLAMRDMQIRGAGNLLGSEQHGFLVLVGYDMYLNLLEKAVRSLKGLKDDVAERIQTSVEIPCEAYLPEDYILSPKERFSNYKKIAAAADEDTLEDIKDELEDRYGPLPACAENLMKVAHLRVLAGGMGITQVTLVQSDLVLQREHLRFKVEVPDLFPSEHLPKAASVFPGLDIDHRMNTISLTLPRSDSSPIDYGIAFAKHISLRE